MRTNQRDSVRLVAENYGLRNELAVLWSAGARRHKNSSLLVLFSLALIPACNMGPEDPALEQTISYAHGSGAGSSADWISWMRGGQIKSALRPTMCIKQLGTSAGSPLEQRTCGGSGPKEVFDYVYQGVRSRLFIRNRNSQQCIRDSGTAVQTGCSRLGVYEAVMEYFETTNGFNIRSAKTGRCLRVPSSAKEGADLVFGSCSGKAAEWKINSGPGFQYYGFSRRSQVIRPIATPKQHFWASTFGFTTSGLAIGGYMGLQRESSQGFARAAVFSIWGGTQARSVARSGKAKAWDDNRGTPTGEGGYGMSCVVPYNWREGHSFTFAIAHAGVARGRSEPFETATSWGSWWKGTVNGTTICEIFVPGRHRSGTSVYRLSSRGSSFSENFSVNHTECKTKDFRAVFSPPNVYDRFRVGPVDSDPVSRSGTDPNCRTKQIWAWDRRVGYGAVTFYK